MSVGDNKTIIHRVYTEVVGNGDLSHVEEFIGASYVDHNAEGPERGPDVVRAHLQALRRTFPDFHLQIDEIFGESDMVATGVSGRGTHRGEWMGIRPTGAVVRVKGINLDRVAGGRIVEHWGEADTVGILRQMRGDPFAGHERS